MDKELKEELTTTLNMVLFSAAILSLMLAGFILAMNDYQMLSCLITLPSYLWTTQEHKDYTVLLYQTDRLKIG